jgi:hypothetical protein
MKIKIEKWVEDDVHFATIEIDEDDRASVERFEEYGLDTNGYSLDAIVDFILRTKLSRLYDEFEFSPEAENLLVTCDNEKAMSKLIDALDKATADKTLLDKAFANAKRQVEEEAASTQMYDGGWAVKTDLATDSMAMEVCDDGFAWSARLPDSSVVHFKMGPFDYYFALERREKKFVARATYVPRSAEINDELVVETGGNQQKLAALRQTISSNVMLLNQLPGSPDSVHEIEFAEGITVFRSDMQIGTSGRSQRARGIRIEGPDGITVLISDRNQLVYRFGS